MASLLLHFIDKGGHSASRDPGGGVVDLVGEVALPSREGRTWWQPFLESIFHTYT